MNQDADGGEVLGCGCTSVGLKLLEKETHLKRLILRVVKSAESRGERMPVFDRCDRGGQRGRVPRGLLYPRHRVRLSITSPFQ